MDLNAIVDPETIYLFQEPVQNEGDIIGFCEESGLLVALDETIDSTREHPLDKLVKYTHPGIVATVSGSLHIAH